MHHVKRLHQGRQIHVFLIDVIDQIYQLALDQVEVVQLEYSRHLEYEYLDQFDQAAEFGVFLVVVDQLQQHLCEQEAVFVGLGLTDQQTLVAQAAVCADVY